MNFKNEINRLKNKLSVLVVAHFYQRDEVYEMADLVGDSFELAKNAIKSDKEFIVFCGVGFMGQSVKILDNTKRVLMPKIACCSMAKMIDSDYFDNSIRYLNSQGIDTEDILPIVYINSNAEVKAKVGKMGGYVCTSSSAEKIVKKALEENKKIFFLPDRCLGVNIANKMNLSSCVIGDGRDVAKCDIVCYDGYCNVHQLFEVSDVEFYRKKYPDILVAVHPECKSEVVQMADFVGSTSQIINYVKSLPIEQKVVVGTEFNLVNRLREKNTFVLSSTKPECPTMNETTLEDLYNTLKSIEDGKPINEIFVDDETIKYAKIALDKMIHI